MIFFQRAVREWMMKCFGAEIASDKLERNHRFLEEALELVQANGCTAEEAHMLVDYTFGRPEGKLKQEVGGVMITLAALCNTCNVAMDLEAAIELKRVNGKIEEIRQKQATKPKGPLPE